MNHPQKIHAAVFDIDGTLALMDKDKGTYAALPGAIAALELTRAQGLPTIAYTNGTFFPPEHYYPLLAAAGLHLDPGHIITPATVAARQLANRGIKQVMMIGAEGTRVPLQQTGIELIEANANAPKVDAVLLAWTPDFNSAQLEAAAQAIWSGAALYATSVAPYFPGAKGKLMGVSGAMAAAINNATGAKAIVFGKPSVDGMEIVEELTKVPAANTAVIGDDPKLEIAMARKSGAYAIGVATGHSNQAAFEAMPEDLRAHIVLKDLTEFVLGD
jgi:4-nitrophenyl phosphatase